MVRSFLLVAFIVVACLAGSANIACAAERIALVIGNGAYRNAAKLDNPANDARDLALVLREIGFEVLLGVDLDRRAMTGAVAGVRAEKW